MNTPAWLVLLLAGALLAGLGFLGLWSRRILRTAKSHRAEAVPPRTFVDGQGVPEPQLVRGIEILSGDQPEMVELGALAKLPPFRPVVISLMRLIGRSDVKTEEIIGLVESDPSLTSELLAVVNSPMFAFRATVANPAHAIILLGDERTKSLVYTLAIRSVLGTGPRTPVVRHFWLHNMATATVAQHFAGFYRVDPHLAYVGGLLHDLGRLGLLAAHPEEYMRMALAAHESTKEILAAEQAAFGMTHCIAGALLAEASSLPGTLRQIAGHHHDAASDQDVVALIQLCCRLADDFLYQAIPRRDTWKPEETIAAYAPAYLREQLTSGLERVNAAVIDAAIQAIDF